MMEIIRQQWDEENSLWHFKIGGIAVDSLYRLADLSRGEEPEAWLAANQAEAQALIDAGTYNEEFASRKVDFEALTDKITGELAYLDDTIATIDGMTAAQVRDVVKRLAQENREMLKAWRYVLRRL